MVCNLRFNQMPHTPHTKNPMCNAKTWGWVASRGLSKVDFCEIISQINLLQRYFELGLFNPEHLKIFNLLCVINFKSRAVLNLVRVF